MSPTVPRRDDRSTTSRGEGTVTRPRLSHGMSLSKKLSRDSTDNNSDDDMIKAHLKAEWW